MVFFEKLKRKLWRLGFFGHLRLQSLFKLPAQTARERRIFKAIFDLLSDKRVRVFEWGSGLSTIYYNRYLKKKGVSFEWHSIDNNKTWHKKVKGLVESKGFNDYTYLYLKEFAPFWEKPGWGAVPPPRGVFSPKEKNEIDYIDFPRTIGGKFDLVIVDARFRRHCLKAAKEVLAPGGAVVIHDAQKPHYQIGTEEFACRRFINGGAWAPFQELPNQVWIGTMDNKKLIDSLSRF